MTVVSKRTVIRIGLGALVLAGTLAAVFIWNHRVDASAIATPAPVKAVASIPEPPTPTPPPPALAAPAPAPLFVAKGTGNLLSANQATLAFQSSGRIKDVKVKQGDRVKAGDVIATLDTAALDAQVVQAQAALDSAVANLAKVQAGPTLDDAIVAKGNVDRAKSAVDQAQAAYDKIGGAANPSIGSSQQSLALQQAYSNYQSALSQYNLTIKHPTDAELKAAQAAVAQAQATFETSKQAAANARITAPFDGTVVWVGSKLGESATAGTSEVTLADLAHMQVQVNADQISTSFIQVGQPVSITVDALPGKTLTGHVSQVGLLASTSGSIVYTPITIDLDPSSARLYPGLSTTVEFQGAQP